MAKLPAGRVQKMAADEPPRDREGETVIGATRPTSNPVLSPVMASCGAMPVS